MKIKKRIVAIAVLGFMLCSSLPVYANKMQDLQRQLNKVNKDVQRTQSLLKNVQKEKQGALYEKERIDQEIEATENELDQINKLLAESEQHIAQTQEKLVQASESADHQYDLLKQRIRVMYEEGSASYLEILLEAESFSDFLARYEIVKQIVRYDQKLFGQMLQDKEDIAEAKRKLEEEKEVREKIKNQVAVKRRELSVQKTSRNLLLQRLSSKQREYEKALDDLEKTSKAVEQEIKRQQALNQRKYAGGELAWATPGYYSISSFYGNRNHPITRTVRFHKGIDIRAPHNANVIAANDGVVLFAGWNGGYGRTVIIDHGGGIATLYAHNSKLLVKVNQKVQKGQSIAKIGTSGVSTGPHLHYEVRENGATVNPMKYYK